MAATSRLGIVLFVLGHRLSDERVQRVWDVLDDVRSSCAPAGFD